MSENHKALVNVIIPVYNAGHYICRCIDSVLAQSWKDIEIILIDDGSMDDSNRICEEYAARNECITVISKPNGGVASARNAGLAAARGKWIIYVDADDYVEPDYVRDMVIEAEKSQCELAVCNFKIEKAPEKSIKSPFGSPVSDGAVTIMEPRQAMMSALLPDAYQTCSWCKLFNREIIEKNNLKYDETLLVWEDYDFFFSYMRYVKKVVYVRKTLYTFVKRHDAISAMRLEDRFRKTKVESKYRAGKKAQAYVRDFYSGDREVQKKIEADRVENAAVMFLLTDDVEKERKYLRYVREHLNSFKGFCGLNRMEVSKMEMLAKYPHAMKRIYYLKNKKRFG